MKKIFTLLLITLFVSQISFAGNPDRQGQAGAYELLLNPWAKSAGLNSMTTANVTGIEAMRLNIAGLSRIENMELAVSATDYFSGSGVSLLAAGFAKKIGKNGSFGFTLMSVNFGDIDVTTSAQPEGTGFTYSPSFVNIGLGYSYKFKNVSVGILFRFVSERIRDLSATGLGIDAGIQYVPADNDRFKFGISLRNIGGRMQYSGQNLYTEGQAPDGDHVLFYTQVSQDFEIPSVLNIGGSYDIISNDKSRFTTVLNFTSNAFSRDNLGLGLEFSFMEKFSIRGGYKLEIGQQAAGLIKESVETGLSAGLSVDLKLKKDSKKKVSLDYSYKTTNPYGGTHALGLRFAI